MEPECVCQSEVEIKFWNCPLVAVYEPQTEFWVVVEEGGVVGGGSRLPVSKLFTDIKHFKIKWETV